MIDLTPKQVHAIHTALTATTTDVRISRWAPQTRAVEVSYFARQRLIQTFLIQPGGGVKVLWS